MATLGNMRADHSEQTLSSHWLPRLLLALAIIHAALFAWFVVDTIVTAPVYDMIDEVLLYAERGVDAFYLWAPHNEHRIVWTRLLLATDIQVFGGTGAPFLVSSILLLSIMLAVLLDAAARVPTPRPLRIIIASMLVLAVLPTSIVTVCSMAAMSANLHCAAFAVLSLALFDTNGRWKCVASLMLALAAALGGSAGLVVWPVLVMAAWWPGRSWRWTAIILLLTIVVWTIFLSGLPSDANLRTIDPGRLVSSIDYGLRFLGLPWSHSPQLAWPGRVIGAIILGWGGFLMVAALRSKRSISPAERLGLRLIVFAFLISAVTACARWNVATDREMPIRYTMFVVLAHAGLILASWRWIAHLLSNRCGTVARPAIAAAAMLLVVQQIVVGQAAVAQTARYNDAWTRFVAGEWTPEMVQYVYPDEARARLALDYLKHARIYGQ